jgi:hypothetical protein
MHTYHKMMRQATCQCLVGIRIKLLVNTSRVTVRVPPAVQVARPRCKRRNQMQPNNTYGYQQPSRTIEAPHGTARRRSMPHSWDTPGCHWWHHGAAGDWQQCPKRPRDTKHANAHLARRGGAGRMIPTRHNTCVQGTDDLTT